uniref:Uncharacterized protein n=1 Tax=Oryza punctata TaxID=4537 RepID=A0A0E0L9R7_ORYPU
MNRVIKPSSIHRTIWLVCRKWSVCSGDLATYPSIWCRPAGAPMRALRTSPFLWSVFARRVTGAKGDRLEATFSPSNSTHNPQPLHSISSLQLSEVTTHHLVDAVRRRGMP